MTGRDPRGAEIRTLSDRQAQARLERMLAARRAADAAREMRFRQLPAPGTQPRPIPPPENFTWVDSAVFLAPVVVVATLVLVAHWMGMLG